MASSYLGQTNKNGVTCIAEESTQMLARITLRCPCGKEFATTRVQFMRIRGCPECRKCMDNTGRPVGRPPLPDDIDTKQFNPAAIWKRICQRHWDRETNIDEIAESRKMWDP
jgi:hypothetical protein